MSKTPAKTLELFFGIEPEIIAADIRRAADDFRSVREEAERLRQIPFNAITAEIEAKRAHLFLVIAHELCRQDIAAEELQTFYAAIGAASLASDAETIQADRATCSELLKKMDAIRQREGLAADEHWPPGKGPADYSALDEKFGELLESVHEMVLVFVLRRYHLNKQADLFEEDRQTFEVHREIARRILVPSADDGVERMITQAFRREHGEVALKCVLERVKEIRSQ